MVDSMQDRMIGDASQILRATDIFVSSPRWEDLPMVLFKAMANGIPIVSTPIEGGIPELVENGKDSILVEYDNPNALAEAILKLLQNENLCKNMVNNSFEKVKNKYLIGNYTFNLLNFCKGGFK